jgi:hypothetical protein
MELGIWFSFIKTLEFQGAGVEPPKSPPAVHHWEHGSFINNSVTIINTHDVANCKNGQNLTLLVLVFLMAIRLHDNWSPAAGTGPPNTFWPSAATLTTRSPVLLCKYSSHFSSWACSGINSPCWNETVDTYLKLLVISKYRVCRILQIHLIDYRT